MTRGRRVVVLSPWPSLWSMSRGVGTPMGEDLVRTLLGAGLEVDFIAPAGPRDADAFPMDPGVRVHRLGRTRVPQRGYAGRLLGWAELTARFVGRSIRVMGRERPAAVYGFSALATPAAALAGHLLRAPSIGALFGTFLHPALGRWRRLAQHVEEVVAFKTPVDRLVILDDGTRGDDVARWFHVPQQRLRFWMHGVDIDRCVTASRDGSIRADLCLSEDTPLVVSPSRLASWKRVDDVLRAFAGVVPDHPRATLVVSGSGPEEAALKALATEILPPANVRFVGALSRDINLRLIAQADVFCSFYDFSNIGYALLEALAAGVAVVVTDTGATTARVTHDMNGLVVPPRDVTAATAAIARLLGDAGLRSRLAANARIHADRTFLTLEDRARLEVELLREIGAV